MPTFLEDIQIGPKHVSSKYHLTKEEIVSFAQRWDPLPIHLNEEAAKAAGLSSVSAPGSLLLAVKQKLISEFGFHDTVVGSFGFENVSFIRPAIAGDWLRAELAWIDARASTSRPGHGVAKHLTHLLNDRGEQVLSLLDTVLIRRR